MIHRKKNDLLYKGASCLCYSFLPGDFTPNRHQMVNRQIPSTGLRHPSLNHCRRVQKNVLANEHFCFVFVGAQTVVSLLQTTQIISNICFMTDHVAYASLSKTKIV